MSALDACACGGERDLRKKKGLRITVVVQCKACGAISTVSARDLRATPAHVLAKLPWATQKAVRRPNSKTRAYHDHLQSKAWKEKRQAVLERDGHECRLGFEDCETVATEAHHVTYERFGNELLEDLVAACSSCNQQERARRPASRGRA